MMLSVAEMIWYQWQRIDWAWSICGIKLTGENRSHRRKNLYRCHFVLHKFNMVWPGSEAVPLRREMVAQPTDAVFHGLFTSLIYIDSESSRCICIPKLPVWEIYSFCEEMPHRIWSGL